MVLCEKCLYQTSQHMLAPMAISFTAGYQFIIRVDIGQSSGIRKIEVISERNFCKTTFIRCLGAKHNMSPQADVPLGFSQSSK